MKKTDFAYQEKVNSKIFFFGFFGLSKVWSKRKTKNFLHEYSFPSADFATEVLMEEIKNVAADKHKFEYRANSNCIEVFGLFELSKTQCMNQKNCIV